MTIFNTTQNSNQFAMHTSIFSCKGLISM